MFLPLILCAPGCTVIGQGPISSYIPIMDAPSATKTLAEAVDLPPAGA